MANRPRPPTSCRPATCWWSPAVQAVVVAVAPANGLKIAKTLLTRKTREAMLTREAGVAEFVIPPRSGLIGHDDVPGMARGGGWSCWRSGASATTAALRATDLAEGDTVLVHGRWSAIESLAGDRDVLVVDSPGHGAPADGSARPTRPAGDRGAGRDGVPCWPPGWCRRRSPG